jgi:hypothetical protein
MATNPYFRHHVPSEANLYEDLIIESIKLYGEDVYYLPRTAENIDTILNEDVESSFDESYMIEMYIENTDGFEGEGNLLSKFGLEIRDEASFIVSRRQWNNYVQVLNDQIRPNEGDLIYLPLSKSLFEISFVEHEKPFFQLSNLPVYKLQCRLFENNDEEFNTGVAEIDKFEEYSFTTSLQLSGVVGIFELQERISQPLADGEFITAEIVKMETNTLVISNIETSDNEYHEFASGQTVTGVTSGATGLIASAPVQFSTDGGAQNDDFTNFESIIDFSESNPFSDNGA